MSEYIGDVRLIDVATATNLEPVAVIAQNVSGRQPVPSTVWRWVREGTRGVKLEAVYLNGRWYTTPEAFAAFVRGQTAVMLQQSVGLLQPAIVSELPSLGMF